MLTILDSERENALGRKGERKKKSEVVSSKIYEQKKRRYAYALCVGDILFEDDELFVCVRIKMRRSVFFFQEKRVPCKSAKKNQQP